MTRQPITRKPNLAVVEPTQATSRLAPSVAGLRYWFAGNKLAWVAILSLLTALILWALALGSANLDRMDDLGLVSALPATYFLALAVLTVGFALVVGREDVPVAMLVGMVVLLLVILHGTPNILYGTLRYSWAWKHVGIVDYIQRHGSVDPGIDYLNAYHNWPGFFALNALLVEAMGDRTALTFAGWAPLFFNLIDMGALVLLLRAFTHDRRLVWLAVWFFYLGNWVGQDYFSPQAFTYFLYIVILGICLAWFSADRGTQVTGPGERPLFAGAARLLRRLERRAAPLNELPGAQSPWQRVGLMTIVVLGLAAVASSHQLMPIMLIVALAALVLFERIRPRSLPVLAMVLTAAWIIFMAAGFLKGNIGWVIQSIGLLTANFRGNLINLAQASPGQVFVAWMDRGLTAGILALGGVGAYRRLRRGLWDLAAAVLAGAPVFLLVMNSYGGEILFRVYFYALPFVAFFAAATIFPVAAAGRERLTPWVIAGISLLLLVGFLFSYYGKDRQYYFKPTEVAAASYVTGQAPKESLLLDGSWDWPLQYQNYEYYNYQSLAALDRSDRLAMLADPVDFIGSLMADPRYPQAFLTITASQKAHVDSTGLLPHGSLDQIVTTLLASGRFKVVFQNRDAIVLTLADAGQGTGQ